MASQEILLSTCDRCTAEERTPLPKKAKKGAEQLVLPKGWLHVQGNTATALVFEMDLCEECKLIVMEVAGKATPVHTTSSKTREKKNPESENKGDSDQGENPNDDNPGDSGLKLVEAG